MPGQFGAPAIKPPGMNGDTEAEHIKQWVKQHFSSTKVDGVTIYDLTSSAQPRSVPPTWI